MVLSCLMSSTTSNAEEPCGRHSNSKQMFKPRTMKIDEKYANVWLVDVPNLLEELLETDIAKVLGK